MTNPDPEPTEPSATPIRDTLRKLFVRPPLRRLPPDDPIYRSGAWVFFPSGEQHQVDQGEVDHV
jgi:hypothetical protein